MHSFYRGRAPGRKPLELIEKQQRQLHRAGLWQWINDLFSLVKFSLSCFLMLVFDCDFLSMVLQSFSNCFPIAFSWFPHVCVVVSLWFPYGFRWHSCSVLCFCFFSGCPMPSPSCFYAIPYGFPNVVSRSSMMLQWFSSCNAQVWPIALWLS